MSQKDSSMGISGPFANIYNLLGLAWWVEVKTTSPNCMYYFGPFLTAAEAETAMPGYIQDLQGEKAEGIEAVVRRCKPREVTVCNED